MVDLFNQTRDLRSELSEKEENLAQLSGDIQDLAVRFLLLYCITTRSNKVQVLPELPQSHYITSISGCISPEATHGCANFCAQCECHFSKPAVVFCVQYINTRRVSCSARRNTTPSPVNGRRSESKTPGCKQSFWTSRKKWGKWWPPVRLRWDSSIDDDYYSIVSHF